MKNYGKIFEITDGMWKGKFCIAYNKEQNEFLFKAKELLVHYFEDALCNVPIYNEYGTHRKGIKQIIFLKFIGFVD